MIRKLQRGQYVLNPEVSIWFDVAEFENLLARAQTIAHPAACIQLLESAAQLYRGDLLDKNYKDWVMPMRTYLREKYMGALLELGSLTEQEAPQQALSLKFGHRVFVDASFKTTAYGNPPLYNYPDGQPYTRYEVGMVQKAKELDCHCEERSNLLG